MSSRSGSLVPVVAPVAVAAVVATGLAVVVNLATGGGSWWLWVVVVALTVAGAGTSLWQYQRQSTTSPTSDHSVSARGERSVAIGRDAHGDITTGDQNRPTSA
ncbi:hypothetical protein ACFQZZ_00490 [Nocardia sp. GCM10030253]|uniref:hypothetical protein n=1 Tax=Nocardia sp. GCM10030253 TaxID=3273404 RepID=UPI00362B0D14